jgi:membrane-associated phospholipid phosphatase
MKGALIVLIVFFSFVSFSQNLDINLLKDINGSYTHRGGDIFTFITYTDNPVTFGIPLFLAAYGLYRKNKKKYIHSLEMLSTTIVSSILTTTLKLSIDRDRPFVTYPDEIVKYTLGGSRSFPSGHTSMCFATATAVSLLYPKWFVIIPMYTWASLVGYSRMYLGVHYPSDVLAGALLGSASAIGTHYLYKYIIKKREQKKSPIQL